MAKKKPDVLELSPEWEVFCQFYGANRDTFGNATDSYAEAYGYDFEKLSNEFERDSTGKRKLDDRGYHIPTDRELAQNSCAVLGARLLRKVQIQRRITELVNEYVDENVVDMRLRQIIMGHNTTDAIAGIREYNKLKQRIVEHTTVDLRPHRDLTDKELEDEIASRIKARRRAQDSDS